jgi:ribulose-5-phosphate 4-epimerase/fuculose-1-phosphate aldolase
MAVEKWLPAFPKFDSLEEERQHRKERLTAGFRLFAKFGFEEGVAGHITARDPIEPDTFWVNPFGVPFAHVTVSSLIRVNHTGEVVEGNYHVNEAAFCIHSQVHQGRPDVTAAPRPRSASCSSRSRRTPARSTTITRCSTTTPASSPTSRRASGSRTPSAATRP